MKIWTPDEVWWGLLWAPNPPEDAHLPPYVGGPGSAAFLYFEHSQGLLSLAQLRQRVGMAWVTCRWSPFLELPAEHWAEMFDAAGLTVNGYDTSAPPKSAVTVYRSAPNGMHTGWAWGNELQAIASIREHRSEGYNEPLQPIYRTIVPPEKIRCMIMFKRWTEYVIDTTGLDIQVVTEQVEWAQTVRDALAARHPVG